MCFFKWDKFIDWQFSTPGECANEYGELSVKQVGNKTVSQGTVFKVFGVFASATGR